MLDKLRAFARHAIIVATPAVAAYLLILIHQMQAEYAANVAVVSALTIAALYLTPLTRQYGVGSA